MKFDEPRMAGSARQSAPDCTTTGLAVVLSLALALSAVASAQELYKYQDENGDWIYADRPPDDGQVVETRVLSVTAAITEVQVTHRFEGSAVILSARNDYYAPVELRLEIIAARDLVLPDENHPMAWVLPPRSDMNLIRMSQTESAVRPSLEFQFRYMPGDPRATHNAVEPYRAPFAISSDHHVTQAYPDAVTHTEPDSYYAVDFSMPIGTDIVAAREGIVFDVAGTNFRSGLDAQVDGPAANVVRILHDDGTYAIYAHLNTNTIRVKPGDRVERGQYIADSGNTGFSTGPHLHFAVVQNVGLRVRSIPIMFLGANAGSVVPSTGDLLTAY